MSAGTATLLQGDDERDLFRRADEALYRAKAHGRNRTEQATAGISGLTPPRS
jgi:PleD family two-component response regulator